MSIKFSIVIIGSGSYGTALAVAIAKSGKNVLLWGKNPEKIQVLQSERCNKNFLPNVFFPSSLYLECSLLKAIQSSRDILIVVPSYAFREILIKIKSCIRKDTRVAWATKGLEPNTGRLLQEVAKEILGNQIPLAIISGPAFARDLAIGLPTSISLASNDNIFRKDLNHMLCCKNFYIRNNSDLIGIQLGGVIKNIIAIGVGISDGIGFGSNTRAMLITYGFSEMVRLGKSMGAKVDTFTEFSGLGDLVLTCTDNRSRNRRFGLLLGRGFSINEARNSIGKLIEGYYGSREIIKLADGHRIDMPITRQIYQILHQNKNVYQVAYSLFGIVRKNLKS